MKRMGQIDDILWDDDLGMYKVEILCDNGDIIHFFQNIKPQWEYGGWIEFDIKYY